MLKWVREFFCLHRWRLTTDDFADCEPIIECPRCGKKIREFKAANVCVWLLDTDDPKHAAEMLTDMREKARKRMGLPPVDGVIE